MSLTALLFVCFLAFCCWPGPAALAEQRLLSGSSLPLTRPVFPEPLDTPRPSPSSRTRRHDRPTASHWQRAPSAFSPATASSSSSGSSQPFSSPSSSSSSLRPQATSYNASSSERWRRSSWPSAGSSSQRSRAGHRHRHQEDSPVLWRVEQGLTLRLWRDSSHVSPRLLALRYRDAPGGQDARDLVPLGDGDAENEADGADDVRNCFYSGEVVGEPGSKAVVSLCHGMTGYIYSPSRGMFTIEPVNGAEDRDQRGAHVLRHHRGGQWTANNSTQDSGDVDGEPSSSRSSNQQQRGSASHRRRRRKRSYSLEQHVEVLVAADSKMARYHGKDLKHYILTLMAAHTFTRTRASETSSTSPSSSCSSWRKTRTTTSSLRARPTR